MTTHFSGSARRLQTEALRLKEDTSMTRFGSAHSVKVKAEAISKAALIYSYTHTAASSLLLAFDDAKAKRGTPRGVLTDQEQDILRASLVMCCAGLDAAIKQVIRDCIDELLDRDAQVRQGFEKFIRKRISGEGDVLELTSGAKFLALVLADRKPRQRLVEEYIKELTGESLQSAEELLRTATALGIDHNALKLEIPKLKDIFHIRNKIIHELDIDLDAPKRKRRVRSQTDLLDNSDHILSVTKKVLEAVDAKI